MGGGNWVAAACGGPPGGLSPRGRGKLKDLLNAVSVVRSIPAWAGETTANPCMSATEKVYPRVGGGNFPSG